MIKKLTFLFLFVFIALFTLQSQKGKVDFSDKDQISFESQAAPSESIAQAQETSPQKTAQQKEKVQIQENTPPKKAVPASFERDEHPFNEDGDLLVSQVLVLEEYAVAHGDILIGSYDEMLELEQKGQLPKMSEPSIWEGGIVPYTIDNDYTYPDRVKKVIDYYHQKTPIRFVEWDGVSEDYVIFASGVEHCFAHLGRRGGPQKVVLSSGCYEAEIAHEIMHVLGFLHEQNREDRDEYLSIHWDNIEEVYHEQFKKMPNPFTAGIGLPFDLNSIMIYSPFSFAVDSNRPTMTKKNGELYERSAQLLSEGDIKKIETLYLRK